MTRYEIALAEILQAWDEWDGSSRGQSLLADRVTQALRGARLVQSPASLSPDGESLVRKHFGK